MLNLHFLGPYLKNNCASEHSYDLIFQLIRVQSDTVRTNIFDKLTQDVKKLKDDLLKGPSDVSDRLETNKVSVLYHLMIQMVLNFTFAENSKVFKEMSILSHELRLLPLPYGLLPHELIEILDNERIIPGIEQMF